MRIYIKNVKWNKMRIFNNSMWTILDRSRSAECPEWWSGKLFAMFSRRSNCCKYLFKIVMYILKFVFQQIAHEILYKTVMKRVLLTNSYEVISDKHCRAPKEPTFNTFIFMLVILRQYFDPTQREQISHFVPMKSSTSSANNFSSHTMNLFEENVFLILFCSSHLNFPLRLITFNFVLLNRKLV
jgi:hypothetical protein